MIIHSENGSGKTLAYLLPVMNDLNHFKDKQVVKELGGQIDTQEDQQNEAEACLEFHESHVEKTNQGFFRLNKSTEDMLF